MIIWMLILIGFAVVALALQSAPLVFIAIALLGVSTGVFGWKMAKTE